MARIIYSSSGEGRGHSSRVTAVSEGLMERGHEVIFCCGGTALEVIRAQGKPVIPIPALVHSVSGNRISVMGTIRKNAGSIIRLGRIIRFLKEEFIRYNADLLIVDFEFFSPIAARRIGLPVISLNHQQLLTDTVYRIPFRYRMSAFWTKIAINLIKPKRPVHTIVTSFYYPELKDPLNTTAVSPIIRKAVQKQRPGEGSHVVVYYNHGDNRILEILQSAHIQSIIYGFDDAGKAAYPDLVFRKPSIEIFLDDVASSRAVICTAGYSLISESLYLGKPLLVIPNSGSSEQILNALFLVREKMGEAVIERQLAPGDLTGFLSRVPEYKKNINSMKKIIGNEEALDCIELVLRLMKTDGVFAEGRRSLAEAKKASGQI